ncbi:MAG: phytoene dehydrogenase [Bacteroidetes bacterium RIFCSPLOWO2_12_FULL_35_15]|nr:MAG: phytoene dehydrogenase [Bacteroidetes bacterium RIFCSPLOWO2_12_FULL_35_15]
MEEFDTIVIGSGSGGLASAICLSRAGQKVLVLEQHYVPGGWCHSFQLNGQRFSPGVHYLGLLEEGQSTNNLFKGLGIANDLVFFRMNKNGFEHCLFGNKRIEIPAGSNNLYEHLAKLFPEEQNKLKKYLELTEKVNHQIQLLQQMKTFLDYLTIPFRIPHLLQYSLFSVKKVIDRYIKDPVLKGVLCIQSGDYGLPPFKASFPFHCVLMNYYVQRGFYPMGGGAGIVKGMANTFKKHGGELRVKNKVKKILIENKQAFGVELEDGTRLFSKRVISNADPSVTYLNLVGKENLSSKLLKKLSKTKYSVTSLILFLTLDMDVKKAGIDSGNMWFLKNENIDAIYYELKESDLFEGEEFPGIFISCTTLKDPTCFNGRYHNLEVIAFIENESFKEFDNKSKYHTEAYEIGKKKIINKFLNNVEKIIPGAKQHVVQAELGTPKTNQFFINSTDGNVYGTEKTFDQIGIFTFKNKSEIKNLYLCGASTLSHGVSGTAYSGVAAAASILNSSTEELLKNKENQQIRIYDAEKESSWPDWVSQKIKTRKRRFEETKLPVN